MVTMDNYDDFDITDHIIKKENTGWEEKWTHSSYLIRKLPDIPVEPAIIKSNEPWYRRFENKRRKK